MNINLGNEISRRRRDQKLTQEDLAELSCLSVNFISRLERTRNQNISIQKLDSIACAFACALNTTTPDIINNAYRFKKVKADENQDNTPAFIQKVTNELRKLPKNQAEHVSKSFIGLLKEINSSNN